MPRREVPTLPPGTRGLVRDAALVPLSREHHTVLVHARALGRAAAGEEEAAETARAYLDFASTALAGHIADEEEVLAPAAVGASATPTSAGRSEDALGLAARRMASEHREIEALTGALAQAMSAGSDVRPVMAELGELLDDHVRFEERAFFMQLQDRLGPAALAAIGTAIDERRAARGGASCALPPPSRRDER